MKTLMKTTVEVLEGKFKLKGSSTVFIYQVTLENKNGIETFKVSYIDTVKYAKRELIKEAIIKKLNNCIRKTRIFTIEVK